MVKFAAHFGINLSQAELDFVNVDTSTDIQVYVDPYAIEIRGDEWSTQCADHVRSFFGEVLEALIDENLTHVTHLLSQLHEPNETCFGLSVGDPAGRAIGLEKAQALANALARSNAFKTGILSDISEAELFIPGFGPDMISDLTTNVIRGPLVEYTQQQCALYNIPLTQVTTIGPIWNIARGDWEAKYVDLPVVKGRPILLVPKYSVRRRILLDGRDFWDFHMIDYLRQEHLDANSTLVKVFKGSKERYVTKASVKEKNKFDKEELATFVSKHPEVLEAYKKLKGKQGPMDIEDFDANFDEHTYARVLIDRLADVPPGKEAANEYHRIAMGITTFLFHPQLITPIKEFEQHSGRKRIDIKFTNSAEPGFFLRMLQSPQTRAISVLMECKNYTKELANPEFDQMAGRFGHQRGFFGMLLCRTIENRPKITEAAKDAASDGRGFMLILDDSDLVTMLEMVEANKRHRIDRFLQQRLDAITA